MLLEAILLGLSTGTYCATTCAPVLVPFLFGAEKIGGRRNAGLVGTFLAARLATYFILGAVFAALGLLVTDYMDPVLARRLSVCAYIFCGAALLFNSLGIRFPWLVKDSCSCLSKKFSFIQNDWVCAVVTGLAVGLHVCPPLWTAIVRSVFGGNGIGGFFYFVFFYVGTLPFFVPLLGIPFLSKRFAAIKRVSRITQFFISLYFLIFMGLIPFLFG